MCVCVQAKEVIAINQDDLGVAGDVVYAEGILQVYMCVYACVCVCV